MKNKDFKTLICCIYPANKLLKRQQLNYCLHFN